MSRRPAAHVRLREPPRTVSQLGAPACPPLYSRTECPGRSCTRRSQSFFVVYPGRAGQRSEAVTPDSGSPSTQPNENATESPTTKTSCGSVGGGGGGPPTHAVSVPVSSATPAKRSKSFRKGGFLLPERANFGSLDKLPVLSRHPRAGSMRALRRLRSSGTLRIRLAVLIAVTLLAGAVTPSVANAAPTKTKPKIKVLMLGDSVGQGLALKASAGQQATRRRQRGHGELLHLRRRTGELHGRHRHRQRLPGLADRVATRSCSRTTPTW